MNISDNHSVDTRVYQASKKAIAYYKVLDCPKYLTPEQHEQGERLRASMTTRDWALQQAVVLLTPSEGLWKYVNFLTGVGVIPMMREAAFSSNLERTPEEQWKYGAGDQHKIIYDEAEAILQELIDRGFVEEVPPVTTTLQQ